MDKSYSTIRRFSRSASSKSNGMCLTICTGANLELGRATGLFDSLCFREEKRGVRNAVELTINVRLKLKAGHSHGVFAPYFPKKNGQQIDKSHCPFRGGIPALLWGCGSTGVWLGPIIWRSQVLPLPDADVVDHEVAGKLRVIKRFGLPSAGHVIEKNRARHV